MEKIKIHSKMTNDIEKSKVRTQEIKIIKKQFFSGKIVNIFLHK